MLKCTMAIPSLPSQYLAKLVLGYLEEEQLMTVYDEFVQASPYLDALGLGNEYDRILMTSLRNILAEYTAVKLHVASCKPLALRKKLIQYNDLLDMVKFLIQYIDISKIQENNQSKFELEKSSISVISCELCKSFKQDICTCNKKHINSSRQHDIAQLDSSVETTSLADLPGNHVTCRRKNIQIVDAQVVDCNEANEPSTNQSTTANDMEVQYNTRTCQSNIVYSDNLTKPSDTALNMKEELNHTLNNVCPKNQSNSYSETCSVDSQKTFVEGYNKFATGVNHGLDVGNANVPDSSTSDNIHVQIPLCKENINVPNSESNIKMKPKRAQYLFKVANHPNDVLNVNTFSSCTLPKLKANPDDNKIKILSDVKVDNTSNFGNEKWTNAKMPKVLKNATSTPLLQMQTIVINGTPVYKQKPFDNIHNYTKDEIMAMPTIILAPVSAPPAHIIQHAKSLSSVCATAATTTMSNSPCHLGPLVIDVSNDVNKTSSQVIGGVKQNEPKDSTEAEVIDLTSASAPKDSLAETNTPQVMPPVRKSSSTPRRSSHVRVLDFTTPRRILHESINKCPIPTAPSDVDVVISSSPNANHPIVPNKLINIDQVENIADCSKENSAQTNTLKKRNNWDADLRALAIIHEKDIDIQPNPTPQSKSVKKKKITKKEPLKIKKDSKKNKKEDSSKSSSKKKLSKSKMSKNNSEHQKEDSDFPISNIAIKPTINIITDTDHSESNKSKKQNESNQNKSNNENDTPEMERISLQNDIGANLNISDLLETPYKQALYDIQMETPRFLGPDLPDDPLSAIKIMNIPTPKFLNAPTPSSYSSRPTDYSSGGSYYKPDDQDYMRIADDLGFLEGAPIFRDNITKQEVENKSNETSDTTEKNKEKSSRPVRKCTKNVSYYNSSNLVIRTKDTEGKITDSSSLSFHDTNPNISEIKSSKEYKPKNQNKTERKAPSKNRKTPVKKDVSKSFMKIKPRRPTPVKNNVTKKKTKTPESSKLHSRKSSTNREVEVNATAVVVSMPTKSRRKSSTPRKLHCTKQFISESSGHDSPELLPKSKENVALISEQIAQDSDNENLALRWSDDGSQETKLGDIQSNPNKNPLSDSNNDIEDINKIKDYINTVTSTIHKEGDVSLHIDLVKRGFDLETAKIIERELLDTTPQLQLDKKVTNVAISPTVSRIDEMLPDTKNNDLFLDKTLESDCNSSNNLRIVQDENEEGDEIELSVHECCEDSSNYFTFSYDSNKDSPQKEMIKLKDKFSMEVCLDDDLSIRLRATDFTELFGQDPVDDLDFQNQHETEMAVRSITNIDKLYTPMKKSIQAQCYEIFDSTLTSLDTPLKVNSPISKEQDVTVTEIVLEVERVEEKEKYETKKRKRPQSGNLSDEHSNESKKAKPEAEYLLNSANIQNIDIESVLSKLHGP